MLDKEPKSPVPPEDLLWICPCSRAHAAERKWNPPLFLGMQLGISCRGNMLSGNGIQTKMGLIYISDWVCMKHVQEPGFDPQNYKTRIIQKAV